MPAQVGHAPSGRLNEKREAGNPVAAAKQSRITSASLVYVAGFERGLMPMGSWLTNTGFGSGPSRSAQPTGLFASSEATSTSSTNVLLPEPDTPVITLNRP